MKIKTVEQLIRELQEIPNPEKVGIVTSWHDHYTPDDADTPITVSDLRPALDSVQAVNVNTQGIEKIVCF